MFRLLFSRLFYLLLLGLACLRSGAQESPKEQTDLKQDVFIEQRIENIAEQSDNASLDYSNLLDDLNYYASHKINLNHTSPEELRRLGLLTDFQIMEIVKHTDKNGNFLSIYELQSLQTLTLDDILKILPYVYVEDQTRQTVYNFKTIMREGRHTVTARVQGILEPQKGFETVPDSVLKANPNAVYLGSKPGAFVRYRFNYGNNISLGITGDKDPGEEFFKGTQPNGFDFYSAHFFIRNYKFIKALAIGDYQAQFGQGLTFWMGMGYGKTADPLMLKRSARGITASNSFNENLFLRGAAATVEVGKMLISGFYSINKFDGSILTDSLDNTPEGISSLLVTGLHATQKDVDRKNKFTQQIAGFNVSWNIRNLHLGVTGSQVSFSVPVARELAIYNQKDFTGKQLFNAGADYNFLWRNFNFYGEISWSESKAVANVHGLIISLDPRFYTTFLFRDMPLAYQNLFSNAVSENTRNVNERGFLSGAVFKISKTVSLSAYYDKFKRPYLYYLINAPSEGSDAFVQLNYNPGKKTEMYMRFRTRMKFRDNSDAEAKLDEITGSDLRNYRFNVLYMISKSIRLRTRADFITYTFNGKTQYGSMVYQDINFNLMGSPLSFNARYGLFDVDDYYARVYTFENDVPHSYSIPAFSGKGTRFYITLDYVVNRHLEIWLRFAQTWYQHVDAISEGTLNEIDGNTRSEIKLQARYRF